MYWVAFRLIASPPSLPCASSFLLRCVRPRFGFLHVRRSVWRKNVGQTKTQESRSSGPVIDPLKDFLDEYKTTANGAVQSRVCAVRYRCCVSVSGRFGAIRGVPEHLLCSSWCSKLEQPISARLVCLANVPSVSLSSSVCDTSDSAFDARRICQQAAVAFGHDGIPEGLACVSVSTS